MPLSTPLCETLGIDHPIVQAPIGSASVPELAAAVSNAGALGTLAVTWLPPELARDRIAETRDATDRPFGVNVVLDEAAKEIPTEEHLDAVLDAGAPVVSLSFGDPSPYADRIRDAGATLAVTVGSGEEARQAVDAGADVVVAQGWEAGGHIQSDVATLPLVPRVADAVDVPVVAAGGIADGRGVAAVLAAGADGAWLGTRFVASEEAAVERIYPERIVEADETETVRSELFDVGWEGRPHRTLHNSTVEEWNAAGRPEPGERPGEGEEIAEYPGGRPILRYGDDLPAAGVEGDLEALALYAGQSTGLTEEIKPAEEIVRELVAETEARVEQLSDLLTQPPS